MDTISKLAQGALTAQNACNLSGVVASFNWTLTELWAHAHAKGEGTDWVNTHPICVLYSAQIAHLSSGSITDSVSYSKAYDACKGWVEEEKRMSDALIGELMRVL